MAIVRVIWGDDRPGCRWHKSMKEVRHTLTRSDFPHHVYVYGKATADELSMYPQLTVHLVNDDPFPDGRVDHQVGRNTIIPWHYKHELILAAFRDHNRVIYCDWDVSINLKDESEALPLLENRPLALTAFMYRRRRPFLIPRSGVACHINVSGSWIYQAGPSFSQQVLMRMNDGAIGYSWHDEMVMNDVVDSWYNGWMGEEVWLNTYESPVVVLGNRRSPWAFNWSQCDSSYNIVTRETPVPFSWHSMFTHCL